MSAYYRGNAVCEAIINSVQQQLVCPADRVWNLVYSQKDATPRLGVALCAESAEDLNERERQYNELSMSWHKCLTERAGLRFMKVCFDDRSPQIEQLDVDGVSCSLNDLTEMFRKEGLSVSPNPTSKAINDKASNAFHNWQRASLGEIIAVDVDLLRVSRAKDKSSPTEIIELKRSYMPLDTWSPFNADFPNFDALSAFSRLAGVSFSIAYNVRHKSPMFFDDPSSLAMFSYQKGGVVSRVGVVSFEDFVQGVYKT